MTRSALIVLTTVVATAGGACRQDMHNQPKAKPQSKSGFFADGRTGRLPVEGTVARGELRDDDHLYRGKAPDGTWATTFPFKIDAAILQRGRERYNIYCSPCHGETGLGNGMVIQRGFAIPAANHHQQRLRDAAVGYWFDVITNGFGRMFGYAAQVPVKDRWAIIAYVRALQLSRNATLEDIPEKDRAVVLSGRSPAAEALTPQEGAHAAPAMQPTPTTQHEPEGAEARH